MSAFCQGFMSLLEIERHTFLALKSLLAFHLGAVATFWPMSFVGITLAGPLQYEVGSIVRSPWN